MTAALDAQFARCRPWIVAALDRWGEGIAPDEVRRRVLAGSAQLWPGEAGALVSECVAGAKGRSIHIWLAGGRLEELRAMRPGMEAWARAMGCEWATIQGRKGWDRVLGDTGFERDGPLLRKRL